MIYKKIRPGIHVDLAHRTLFVRTASVALNDRKTLDHVLDILAHPVEYFDTALLRRSDGTLDIHPFAVVRSEHRGGTEW